MSRVLLLLDQKENQRLLAETLAGSHDILVAESDEDLEQEFDLCILDGPSLDRLWERVQERKSRDQPILLPVLLVTSRPDVKMITRHLWRSVDELIITPIEKPELGARLQILLRARSLSLALRERVEAAEDATRTRDEVLALVSHDLRNPLNLVLTSATLLRDRLEELGPKEEKQLGMIHRAAGQMNRLIQDLLDVSGLEAGHLSIDPSSHAVAPLIREACAVQEHVAEGKGIAVSCDAAPDLPEVHADGERILQVLGNLIGNALKFTDEGGRVGVRAVAAGEDVQFSVTDTGMGITEEDLPHVFDRFWQARRTGAGGAGLGLAIAAGIVEAHGGRMWVESEVERGSTFHFTLPVARASATD